MTQRVGWLLAATRKPGAMPAPSGMGKRVGWLLAATRKWVGWVPRTHAACHDVEMQRDPEILLMRGVASAVLAAAKGRPRGATGVKNGD